ncbi:hypothetical protein KIW84_075659 [Lathyrus oleraceus]|uniref:Clu domain-containing protein n=1 Tax=Pisum sativum TaxID=3888 RepID=A0A9D4VVW5_PEA|nr:hypothetical protein KIW84_075659 [Pisum sativum]
MGLAECIASVSVGIGIYSWNGKSDWILEVAASVVCTFDIPLGTLLLFISAWPHEFTDYGGELRLRVPQHENTLDPRPDKATSEAMTLVALLQKISPRRDASRAENALTLLYGSEPIGMQRDWNEELQSCREFSHTTPQERILRDRELYKVTSDFVDAAINGATGVISGCIPPINPTDPECFHICTGTLQNSSDKVSCVRPHGDSPVSNGGKDDSSSLEDYNSTEITQDISPEVQLAENEQAIYASANNDLKGTKAYQEADVPGLYNLAVAIIDYRGHRVVAQSVLPGILQVDKSDSLLYGSVDNGKKISWNEDFHTKMTNAALITVAKNCPNFILFRLCILDATKPDFDSN